MVVEAGAPDARGVSGKLAQHREHLWALCYRMTASSADADDLVQETFRRALEHPPTDLERDLRPWLVRVAVNLSRDALRERKRRGYDGTWLPSPIETPEPFTAAHAHVHDAETRYGERQSVTFAFLIALEALSSSQRAVLLLRDVFDYSVSETASALQISEPSVKTTLHRARAAMTQYEASARLPTPEEAERTRAALQAFCVHLFSHNVPALEALLAKDVRARNDGGGEFFAARRPILGLHKVILFHLKTATTRHARFEIRNINGLPALVAERFDAKPGVPPRVVMCLQLDADGRIRELDSVVATPKLSAMRFDTLPMLSKDMLPALRAALTHPPLEDWLPHTLRLVRARVVASVGARVEKRVASLRARVRMPDWH